MTTIRAMTHARAHARMDVLEVLEVEGNKKRSVIAQNNQ